MKKELLDEDVNLEVLNNDLHHLILFNDEVNSLQWVIKCLMEVCNHTLEQAEQLSLIVHFKKKATVKTADYDTLKPLREGLNDRGLNSIIE